MDHEKCWKISPLSLPKVHIANTHLKKLPPAVCSLINVYLLDLTGNKVSRLPKDLRKLSCLKKIVLRRNKFAEFPSSLCHVYTLEEIDFGENRLQYLPKDIKYLKTLSRIDLSGNKFEEFPTEICSLTSLKDLSFSDNALSDIPFEFKYLEKLEKLNLSNNKFREFPVRICFQPSLVTIVYAQPNGTKAKSLPESIAELRNLQNLVLDHNDLELLPDSIGRCSKLRNLSVVSNRLCNLPDSICDLVELENLKLGGNLLKSLPTQLRRMSGIRDIDVELNPIENPPMAIAESRNIDSIGRYVYSSDSRGENLLKKMMEYAAKNIDISDFERTIVKLKLPHETIMKVVSNKSMAEHQQLFKLFKLWRKRYQGPATDAQDKFLHILDLVDLPKILSRLKAMKLAAKATRL